MTFKTNAVKRTVTGTFQKPNGDPSQGKIFIKLSEPVLGREENTIYTRQAVEIELDANGSFSEDLAVTSPGLTAEEQTELDEIQADIEAETLEMVAVQERINTYLKKIYDNETITEADVLDHQNDLQAKMDLQASASVLKQRELVFIKKKEELEKAAVVMRVECQFSNPRDQSKLFLIIPPGNQLEPIDIADLPRE